MRKLRERDEKKENLLNSANLNQEDIARDFQVILEIIMSINIYDISGCSLISYSIFTFVDSELNQVLVIRRLVCGLWSVAMHLLLARCQEKFIQAGRIDKFKICDNRYNGNRVSWV